MRPRKSCCVLPPGSSALGSILSAAQNVPARTINYAMSSTKPISSLLSGVVSSRLCIADAFLLFSIFRGDGLVTPENLDTLREHNFSGRRYRKDFSVSDLVTEISKYRQEYGDRLREIAIAQFGLEENLPRLLEIYHRVKSEENSSAHNLQRNIVSFISDVAQQDLMLAKQLREHYGVTTRIMANEIKRVKSTISWRITSTLRVAYNSYRRFFS